MHTHPALKTTVTDNDNQDKGTKTPSKWSLSKTFTFYLSLATFITDTRNQNAMQIHQECNLGANA